MNGEKVPGNTLKEKYKISGYPTTVYLNSDGSEIDRIFGWDGDARQYYQIIVDYTNGKNTLSSYITNVTNHPEDVHANYQMAKKYVARGQHELAEPYFEKVTELEPEDQSDFLLESESYLAVYHLYQTGEDEPLLTVIKQLKKKDLLGLAYHHLLRYHKRNKNHDRVVAAYPDYIERFPDRADLMNDYAWYIYENKLQEEYSAAISLAWQAVNLEPGAAHIWDTLAWLEYEAGMDSLALAHMKIAVEKSDYRDDYRQNLQKMLAGSE